MNYYVMDRNSQMRFRGFFQACVEWCDRESKQYRDCGMKPPPYRIFYDSAREPTKTFNAD